jgi:cephalosporin-C deacetylase-like acetyl esterase
LSGAATGILAAITLWAGAAGAAEPAAELSMTIISDRPSGIYALGEAIRWRVEPGSVARFGPATYTLRTDGLLLLRQGRLELASTMEEIDATLPAPGTLFLEVRATDHEGKAVRAVAGAVVAPDRIPPSAPRPADFDRFWQAKLDELAKVSAHPRLVARESDKPAVDYWQITMNNIRGTHIQGQLARPNAGERFPALLVVQSAGVYGLAKGWATDPASAGWLVLNISAHDLPIDETPEFYEQQARGSLTNYPAIGNQDREKTCFLPMFLSCYRAVEYLSQRPDWDGKTLLAQGVGQGGMLALVSAALNPKVSAVIAGVPAGCDLAGPQVGRRPGWPAWSWLAQGKDTAKVIEASRYYDVVNLAPRIKCPVLVGIGLVDETCPPVGIFAAVNQLKGPREVVIMPAADHQGSGNSQQTFNERSRAWQQELQVDKPPPVIAWH